jgi:hypothetical protein
MTPISASASRFPEVRIFPKVPPKSGCTFGAISFAAVASEVTNFSLPIGVGCCPGDRFLRVASLGVWHCDVFTSAMFFVGLALKFKIRQSFHDPTLLCATGRSEGFWFGGVVLCVVYLRIYVPMVRVTIIQKFWWRSGRELSQIFTEELIILGMWECS